MFYRIWPKNSRIGSIILDKSNNKKLTRNSTYYNYMALVELIYGNFDKSEEYLSKVLSRITFIGAIYLVVIAGLPIVFGAITDLPSSVEIGGTSLLIVVGVAIETAKQIQTKTMDQKYKGFIK